ncbi:MAG TPA: hypothetical protein VN380_03115 [Thermoanaerobaculia bacterium]|jgi:hypothetical protein|nr:hypothetical protein [Thermoanaerobaculia bacterium]
MRLATMIAVVSIASSAFADSASLRHAIERGREESRSFLESESGYDIPSQRVQEAVSKAVLASEKPDLVVAEVAKALVISRAAATLVVEAYLQSVAVMDGSQNAAEALARQALHEAPGNRDVLAFYLSLAPEMTDDEFAATYLPLIRSLPQAGDAAIVAGAVSFGGNRSVMVIAEALHRDPESATLREALMKSYDSALSATFGPVRFEGDKASFRDAWKGVASGRTAWDAASQIAALANAGRAADVLADFDALPKNIRDAIAAGALQQDGQPLDVRLTLAASAILCGNPGRAKGFIANVHPVKPEQFDPAGDQFNDLRMLQALLAPELKEDIYDILADTINSSARPNGGVWSAVFAALATRGGYESVGTAALRNANRWEGTDVARVAQKYLPDSLRAELQATIDRNAASIAALHANQTGDVSDDAIRKRLAQPRIEPFLSKKMPSSIGSSEAVVAIDCGDAHLATMHIPPGWYPIRLEQTGEEVSGVAVSQSLDPSGEVGRGAYWVLHSCDGGRTWDEPLYTGLRENAPYVVLPESRLPLAHGDHLEVEVDLREIDPDSITFPPVALRVKREEHGLYLALPWETLRRDSDGDGITDLVEERIATDPFDADSDGDGIADGKDGLPLVALTAGGQSAESEVLAALLRGFETGAGALVVGLPSTGEERNACVVRASVVGDGALFLVGDRGLFAPIDINRRVIVLTRDEMDAYEKKFGPTYAADLSFMIVRHDGQKALVVLNESWKEDVFELTKTKDGWIVKVVGGWIS